MSDSAGNGALDLADGMKPYYERSLRNVFFDTHTLKAGSLPKGKNLLLPTLCCRRLRKQKNLSLYQRCTTVDRRAVESGINGQTSGHWGAVCTYVLCTQFMTC
jgi:hypothetical protein